MYPINKTSIKPPSLKSFVKIFRIYIYIYVYLSILEILEIKKTKKKKKYEKERFNESIVSLNHRLIRKISFTPKKKN